MKWVKWTQWAEAGMVGFGRMPLRDIPIRLQEFEREAKKVLVNTGADHVLCGVKNYDDGGEITEVKFYMLPMIEADFQKNVASIRGVQVYALHARRPGDLR